MGTRRKKEIAIKHLETNLYIQKFNNCKDCPCRIYAKEDEKIMLGVGNICTDIIFVLPTYDINAKIGYKTLLTLLQNVYKDITTLELLENTYVTRVIKCYKVTDFNLHDKALTCCINHLVYELCKLKPKKVVFIGDQFYHLADYLSNITKIDINNFYKTYNIGVLYYDNEYKDKFIEQLKEILYD